VDGFYVLDPLKPTAGALGSKGFEDPACMRNLLVVVRHSTEPSLDARRPPLTTVDLPQRSLGDDGAWVLKQSLAKNKSVTVLNLPNNFIATDGACALGGLLAERPSMLVRLNLGGNGIGYDGCLALALGLQRNHSLTSLELPRNRVGDDGADALAGGLEGHRCLLNLELGNNFIHDGGLIDICRSLLKNNSLVRLGLADNKIGPAGCRAAGVALLSNQRLLELNLSNNHTVGPEGAAELGKLLAHQDCALEILGLSGCSVMSKPRNHNGVVEGDEDGYDDAPKEGIYRFSLGLARNHSLRQLTLANNGINNWGARELAVALQENTSVVSLALEGNFMEDAWLKPAHTLHTEVDPSIRSIASSVLRNGEMATAPPPHWAELSRRFQADGVTPANGSGRAIAVPLGARTWDPTSGAPGMVVASGNRGDQDGARRRRRRARRMEKDRRGEADRHRLVRERRRQQSRQRAIGNGGGSGAVAALALPGGNFSPDGEMGGPGGGGYGSGGSAGYESGGDEGDDSDEGFDEAALAEAEYWDGDERNFVADEAVDPLDPVARRLKELRRLHPLGVKGCGVRDPEDGVWRDEGLWAARVAFTPPTPENPVGSVEQPPRWLSKEAGSREAAERREVVEVHFEKLRIADENAAIKAAVEASAQEGELFVRGHPCAYEAEPGLGKRLVESLAVNVIEKDAREREKARGEGRLRLAFGKPKEVANRLVFAYGDRCKREDLVEVFDSFDADCSGFVDHAELGNLVAGLGVKLTPEELALLASQIDKDGSGEVGVEEFLIWHKQGGMERLVADGPPVRKWAATLRSLLHPKRIPRAGELPPPPKVETSRLGAPRARADRLWRAVITHLAERRARAIFRQARPPRRGCVCAATGFAFPSAEALALHSRTFDFASFRLRARKLAARERLAERAREAIDAVPLYPRVVCFGPGVPAFVELTAYDVPDKKVEGERGARQ